MGRILRWKCLLLVIAGLLVGAPGAAQVVNLSRCRAAAPCAFPFAVQYQPDPLLGGQYGFASQIGFSARVSAGNLVPEFDHAWRETDRRAVEAAVREYLRFHPAPEAKR